MTEKKTLTIEEQVEVIKRVLGSGRKQSITPEKKNVEEEQ